MTIKDIARLSGFSISTVSKVINKKDSGISQETKKHILDIVEQNNFIPYENIRKKKISSRIIGLFIKDIRFKSLQLLENVISIAQEHNFQIMPIYQSLGYTIEHFNLLESSILFDDILSSLTNESNIVPDVIVTSQENLDWNINADIFCVPYRELGYLLIKQLVQANHLRINIIVENKETAISNGFTLGAIEALQEADMPFNSAVIDVSAANNDQQIFLNEIMKRLQSGVTGFITDSMSIADSIRNHLSSHNYRLGLDYSINTLSFDSAGCSSSNIDHFSLSQESVRRIVVRAINRVHTKLPKEHERLEFELLIRGSVQQPMTYNPKPKITVIGSLNIDYNLHCKKFPRASTVGHTDEFDTLIGGKALLHAISAKRLSCDVSVLGCVGNDSHGRLIISELEKEGINTKGITIEEGAETGQAFVLINPKGRMGILLHDGANSYMNFDKVEQFKEVVNSASFCIVDNELPIDAINHFMTIAKAEKVPIVIKMAQSDDFQKFSLDHVQYIVFEKSLSKGIDEPFRQLINSLFDRKVVNIILLDISAGKCLHIPRQEEFSNSNIYELSDYQLIDAKGISTGFISSLAACLSTGNSINEALLKAMISFKLTATSYDAITSYPSINRLNKEFTNYNSFVNVSEYKTLI